jgi:hypothetical protein
VAHHCGTGSGLRKEPVALGYFVSVIVKDGPRLWPLAPPALIDVVTPADHGRAAFPGQDHPSQRPDRSYSDGPKGQPPRTSRQTRSPAYSRRSRPCQCLDRNAATNRGEQWRCPADTDIHPYRHASRRWRLQRRRYGTRWHLRQHRKRHYPLFRGTYNFHAVPHYGTNCPASLEAFWSLTVGLKDDLQHSGRSRNQGPEGSNQPLDDAKEKGPSRR